MRKTVATITALGLALSLSSLFTATADGDISTVITLTRGDIAKQTFKDPAHAAIVNAANKELRDGAGVCGAIYQAAGWRENPHSNPFQLTPSAPCAVGEARVTEGGKLAPLRIIHAVGPNCNVDNEKVARADLLGKAYANSLRIAVENDITAIAFPCISTAIYAYAPAEAAPVAIQTVLDFLKANPGLTEVRFVVFDKINYDLYAAHLLGETQISAFYPTPTDACAIALENHNGTDSCKLLFFKRRIEDHRDNQAAGDDDSKTNYTEGGEGSVSGGEMSKK
jgi:O-acetyl-ADP-ribose deacetylase (regulator of RNase III)